MEKKQDYSGALEQAVGKKEITPKELKIGGWQELNLALLSYKGSYYPPNTSISVKPFGTDEVIYFTSVNEKNPLEVDRAMRYLIEECVQVRINNIVQKPQSVIFNIDRFAIILLARLYSDMKTDLTFEHTCSKSKCGHTQKLKVIPQNLVFTEDKIKKYYNANTGIFEIDMKSSFDGEKVTYGYAPITIKENTELFDYMMEKREDIKESELKSLSKLFPFMRKEMADCKSMEDVYVAFKDLGKNKIIDLTKLADNVVLDFSNTVSSKCGECGHMEGVPMQFPNGIKSIVVDTITDDDFLL